MTPARRLAVGKWLFWTGTCAFATWIWLVALSVVTPTCAFIRSWPGDALLAIVILCSVGGYLLLGEDGR